MTRTTIRAADYILNLGPGAGVHGGELVAAGRLPDILACKKSLTGQYLTGELEIPIPKKRVVPSEEKGWLEILGARENNLQNIDVRIPLGTFTCVTGVRRIQQEHVRGRYPAPSRVSGNFSARRARPGEHRVMKGIESLDKVIVIDQSPIGRTPRSNP